MSNAIPLDDLTKTKIVYMILNKKTEEALQHLSKFYNMTPPEIVVGTVKGKRKTVYAVYVQKESKIYATNSDVFYNPFIILHEFYHHIRTKGVCIGDLRRMLTGMQKVSLMLTIG